MRKARTPLWIVSLWRSGRGCPLLPHPIHPFFLHRVAWLILACARRTSTFRGCAFREQETTRLPTRTFPIHLVLSDYRFFPIVSCKSFFHSSRFTAGRVVI